MMIMIMVIIIIIIVIIIITIAIIIIIIIIIIITIITIITIMIGKLVSRDCHRGKRNLSMARIAVPTKRGNETSSTIRFSEGLPEGRALFPRLNTVAWKLNAT